jgi:hypothetical protein
METELHAKYRSWWKAETYFSTYIKPTLFASYLEELGRKNGKNAFGEFDRFYMFTHSTGYGGGALISPRVVLESAKAIEQFGF